MTAKAGARLPGRHRAGQPIGLVPARDVRPFSDRDAAERFYAKWCGRCDREPTCPIRTTAVLDATPKAWKHVAANTYQCKEFSQRHV